MHQRLGSKRGRTLWYLAVVGIKLLQHYFISFCCVLWLERERKKQGIANNSWAVWLLTGVEASLPKQLFCFALRQNEA